MRHLIPNLIWVTLLLLTQNIQAQQLLDDVVTSLDQPVVKESKAVDSIIWTEDISKREIYSTTYLGTDNHIKVVYGSRPLNYLNSNGDLVPIIKEPSSTNGGWEAAHQPYPTSLSRTGRSKLSLDNNEELFLGASSFVNGEELDGVFRESGMNKFIQDYSNGTGKVYEFRENGLKYSYVLNQPLPTSEAAYTFGDEIELPLGYTISADHNYGKAVDNGWEGDLNILNREGEVVGKLFVPIVFDADRNHTLAAYKVRVAGAKQFIEICVDKDWMESNDRSFPIVVDPVITGPTASWAGGFMNSCVMPIYNKDSILVTIPGQVTITELNVTSSFYADPFTTAVMADGSMTFQTSCAESQSFTVTGATGNSPGTAYLDNFNLIAPITCCFSEKCVDSSFYLTMNLGRVNTLGTGCNLTYIRYDMVTAWPFTAEVVGKTPEAFAGEWVVPQTPICADECNVTGVGYVYYGVAPYTFSHPWSTQNPTQGQNNGCANGSTTFQFTMDIPNCPVYCDENFITLSVPPCVITDACGNSVDGLIDEIVPIKPVPQVTPNYASTICSTDSFGIVLDPCLNGANLIWAGNGDYGTAPIILGQGLNNTSNADTLWYEAYASLDGCYSDTTSIPVYVLPLPDVSYQSNPDPIVSGVPVQFTDQTVSFNSVIDEWEWVYGDGNGDLIQDPSYTYMAPGEYYFCLKVTEDMGCEDSLCEMITVVPAEVGLPNVVTPNGDGVNDLLEFKYLEFYPYNELVVLNRWGNVLYEISGYQNDWDGSTHPEGTYFYRLRITETDKEYSGFFHIEY